MLKNIFIHHFGGKVISTFYITVFKAKNGKYVSWLLFASNRIPVRIRILLRILFRNRNLVRILSGNCILTKILQDPTQEFKIL